MGCDIHLYVEARRETGVWESKDTWTRDEDCEEVRRIWDVDYDDQHYTGCNYALFAILANVRNEPVRDIDEVLIPISEPRGLPSNTDLQIQRASDHWGEDGHSHSWLTLRELMEFDWTRMGIRRALVDGNEYTQWARWNKTHGERPSSCCADVYGPSVRHVTEQEMVELIAAGCLTEEELSHIYCAVVWTQPYYKLAAEFLSTVVPRLWRLGSPDNVRIVFWFDN